MYLQRDGERERERARVKERAREKESETERGTDTEREREKERGKTGEMDVQMDRSIVSVLWNLLSLAMVLEGELFWESSVLNVARTCGGWLCGLSNLLRWGIYVQVPLVCIVFSSHALLQVKAADCLGQVTPAMSELNFLTN